MRHIFSRIRREEGTKAAVMPDQLPEQIKKERSRVLIALGQERQREYMEQFLGKKKEVLFEEQQKIQGQTYWTGHTMEYLKVAVISEENLENKRVMVQLQNIIGQVSFLQNSKIMWNKSVIRQNNSNRQNVTKLINSNGKFKKTVNLIEFLHLLY